MNLLRQRLLHECPPLHEALERSWQMAREGWLPSIKPSAGSYNSEPHFRNIEGHLERLLFKCGSHRYEEQLAVSLSALEIYLLLSSVLFHDVGRVRGDTNHAYASLDILHTNFAELGIPNLELACSLGRIAVYHDPVKRLSKDEEAKRKKTIVEENALPKDRRREARAQRRKSENESKRVEWINARKRLSELSIEPFGRARELYVATLLALADHMDGSVRRAVPMVVSSDDDILFKGAFRRMVLGSVFEPTTRCIKTCIHNPWEHASSAVPWDLDAFTLISVEDDIECVCADDPRVEVKFPPAIYHRFFSGDVQPCCRVLFCRALCDDWRLTRAASQRGSWPADYTLARVLADAAQNNAFLNHIRNDLREMGLLVESWLIEFKGCTYNERGEEQQEPVFTDATKRQTADGMKELSCQAFAHGPFSYEALSDRIRQPDVNLVRLTVQRLKRDADSKDVRQLLQGLELRAYPDSWELRSVARTRDK